VRVRIPFSVSYTNQYRYLNIYLDSPLTRENRKEKKNLLEKGKIGGRVLLIRVTIRLYEESCSLSGIF